MNCSQVWASLRTFRSNSGHRRIPFHIRQQLEEQLRKGEEVGVMEHIQDPTLWVSLIIIALKPKQPGKIRLCVDMRQANQTVKCGGHLTPTIEKMMGGP